MNKKILLTGGSGQLGQELLKLREYDAPTHTDFNLLDKAQMFDYLRINEPQFILHAAAFTKTLAPETSPDAAYACYMSNVIGTRHLVDVAMCPIIYISTESAVDPYNFYVLTKMQGENEVKHGKQPYTIIRTSFRERPFEYDKACMDVWTIGDYVDVIAKEIDKLIDNPMALFINNLIYVGTGAKTTYDLAKQTKPDIAAIKRAELINHIPSFAELKNI